jgi:hypothetical protein
MALSNAEKQAAYRRRQAVKRASNGWFVTRFREECQATGNDCMYAVIEDIAMTIANAGGDGATVLNRLAFLLHGIPTLSQNLQQEEKICRAKHT